MPGILEIACFNSTSALQAASFGADRIELCEDYAAGGITPSEDIILHVRNSLSIPVFVMIRPRGGNFTYSAAELEIMKSQVLFCRANKIDGIVFGILDDQNNIDRINCDMLLALAGPMEATFHRAFDQTGDPADSLETLISCGFSRVLTSGKSKTALDGMPVLSSLCIQSAGRIIIMPGGGIRATNIADIIQKTGATEFHSAALDKTGLGVDESEIRKMKMQLQ